MSYTGQFATNCTIPEFRATQPNAMARSRHIARHAVTSIQIAFPWWHNRWTAGSYGEDGPGNSCTLSCAIEFAGVNYPVTWSGAGTVSLSSDTMSPLSDPVSITLSPGDVFFVRSYQDVGAAAFVLTGTGTGVGTSVSGADSANGEALYVNTASVVSGTGALSVGTLAAGLIYRPCLLVASLPDTAVSWLLVGDSRCQGIRDVYTGTSSDKGNTARAIGTAYGYINIGVPGESADAFITLVHTKRVALGAYCSHICLEHGINDAGSPGATIVSRNQTIAGYFSGKKNYLVTLAPKSTSTDSWATTVNQTTDATNANRVVYNNLVRAGVSGMDGYFEIADVVESARDSGKWAVNGGANWYTDDGVHETNTANLATQAAAVPGAPTIGTATKTGATTATVAFTAPVSIGLSAITSYTALSSPGSVVATGTSSPITETGLTPATSYTFTVSASNILGTGAASAASNSITTDAGGISGLSYLTGVTIGTGGLTKGINGVSFGIGL